MCSANRIALILIAKIESLQDVENLRDVDATGTRRWKADNLPIAISRNQRFSFHWLVVDKIGSGEDSAVCRHPLPHGFGKISLIKPSRPQLGDPTIRTGQVGLTKDLALAIGGAVLFEQHRFAAREQREFAGHAGELSGVDPVDGESLFGDFGRGQQQVGKPQLSTFFYRQVIGGQCTRNTDRQRSLGA